MHTPTNLSPAVNSAARARTALQRARVAHVIHSKTKLCQSDGVHRQRLDLGIVFGRARVADSIPGKIELRQHGCLSDTATSRTFDSRR